MKDKYGAWNVTAKAGPPDNTRTVIGYWGLSGYHMCCYAGGWYCPILGGDPCSPKLWTEIPEIPGEYFEDLKAEKEEEE